MNCFFCGAGLDSGVQYCPNCGAETPKVKSNDEMIIKPPSDLMSSDSTSGSGMVSGSGSLFSDSASSGVPGVSSSPLPSGNPESGLSQVRGWNWGAFVFGWIWAFGNGLPTVGIILLVVSFLNLGLIANIVVAISGNEMLWKKKRFTSVQEFKDIQGKWAIAAMIFLFGTIGLVILAFGISSLK